MIYSSFDFFYNFARSSPLQLMIYYTFILSSFPLKWIEMHVWLCKSYLPPPHHHHWLCALPWKFNLPPFHLRPPVWNSCHAEYSFFNHLKKIPKKGMIINFTNENIIILFSKFWIFSFVGSLPYKICIKIRRRGPDQFAQCLKRCCHFLYQNVSLT